MQIFKYMPVNSANWEFIFSCSFQELKKKTKTKKTNKFPPPLFFFDKDSHPFLFQKERKAPFPLTVEAASQIAPAKGSFPLQPALTYGFRWYGARKV